VPHATGVREEAGAVYGVPLRPTDLRQESAVHGVQARVLHEDDQGAEVCSPKGAVHRDTLCAESGMRAGAGDRMLSYALLPTPTLRLWLRLMIRSM